MTESEVCQSALLPKRIVIYCGACGMPPEFCEYGPDFETHCDPWLKKNHPELRSELLEKRGVQVKKKESSNVAKPVKPDNPRTTEERLMAFYEQYVPEKVETVPSLLEKYEGKEDKLFAALTKKYGPEPHDPFYSDSEEEDSSDDEDDDNGVAKVKTTSKRRGASAKAVDGPFKGRVVVQKKEQRKRRCLTVVTGLDDALAGTQHKLKDASKAFSKRFAGSSSEKKGTIILQGDHVVELAEMIVDKFEVPEGQVYIDMGDGEEIPLTG